MVPGARAWRSVSMLAALLLASAAGAAGPDEPAAPSEWRVGVVRFAGPLETARDLSISLAAALSEHEGVVVKELDEPAGRPEASGVRRLAARLGVASLVVGEVERVGDGLEASVELRSGHSGGAVARLRESLPETGDAAVVTRLAEGLLQALDWAPPEPVEPAEPGPVAQEQAAPEPAGGGRDLGSARRDQPIRIKSRELEVIENAEGRHFIFTEDVVVTQADLVLTTDRLDAYYLGDASQPDRLVARGRVRVQNSDRRAQCDEATYASESQQVVCTGHAVFVQGCDRVRGDEIQLDLAQNRVRVIGAPSVVIHPEADDGGGPEGGAAVLDSPPCTREAQG